MINIENNNYMSFNDAIQILQDLDKIQNKDNKLIGDIFNIISNSENNSIITLIVSCEYCPSFILEKLYNKNINLLSLCVLLQNKNCPVSILEKECENKLSFIRKAVIQNLNCPHLIFQKLYEEFSEDILKNPNCPDYIKVFNK